MKKIAVLTFVIALGFVNIAQAKARTSSKAVMVTHKEAKVRSGPATSYQVLWRPRLYTPLEILANFIDEKGQAWYAVRDFVGDIGWIHNSAVKKKKSAIVVVKMADVRKTGNSGAQVLFQAPREYTFKVLNSKSGWYQVQDPEGDKGWIPNKSVWTGRTPNPKKGPRIP